MEHVIPILLLAVGCGAWYLIQVLTGSAERRGCGGCSGGGACGKKGEEPCHRE